MGLTFLTPLAALVGLAALVPLAVAFHRERRAARLRRALGLAAPGRLARAAAAVALVAVVGLLAVAAAQPAVRERRGTVSRTDAQAFVVFDVSRSMLAAAGPGAPTRLERARAFAERLRAAVPELPTGVATLTDRILPNLFPSPDQEDFREVVRRAVRIDAPPPVRERPRATDFGGIVELTTQNYFGSGARRRVAVLLTDGESDSFDAGWIGHWLRAGHIGLVVVRFWHAHERIYGPRGVDPGYRPDAAAAAGAGELARAASRGRAFGDDDLAAAAREVRRLAGKGPTAPAARAEQVRPLSGYAVAAAALPLAFLLLGRDGLRLRLRSRRARAEQGGELERGDG